MTHARERWVVLRRSVASGVIGGSQDGAGVSHPSLTTWQVEVACDHAALSFEVEVDDFLDLLTGMTVLAYRHEREVACGCVETDISVARRALDAWRREYHRNPYIDLRRLRR